MCVHSCKHDEHTLSLMAELLYYINYLRDRPCAPCCHFQRRILMWMSPDLSCHQRLVYLTVRCRYVSFGMNVYGGSFLHLQYLSYLYILSFCLGKRWLINLIFSIIHICQVFIKTKRILTLYTCYFLLLFILFWGHLLKTGAIILCTL